MNVIDVAQRAASRDRAPMIQFRRTTADRRPARRVAMPNDGPGLSWEERLAKSRAALARIEAPKRWMNDQTENQARVMQPEASWAKERMRRYLEAVANGAENNAAVAIVLREDRDSIYHVSARLVKRGFLTKGAIETIGRLRVAPLAITDAGRAWLETAE